MPRRVPTTRQQEETEKKAKKGERMHDNPVSEQTDNVLFGTEGDGALSASKSPERPSAQSRESEKEVFDTDSTTFDTA